MNPTPVFYELLLRGDDTGALAGMHYIERTIYRDETGSFLFERIGDAQPLTAGTAKLAALLPELNGQALARVQALTGELANAQAAAKSAQDDAAAKGAEDKRQSATIEELRAQLAAVSTPANPTPPAQQNAAQQAAAVVFNALPAGKRALWEPVRAAVDVALAAGDLAGAREIIATVPAIYEGMEADRDGFLALFAARG